MSDYHVSTEYRGRVLIQTKHRSYGSAQIEVGASLARMKRGEVDCVTMTRIGEPTLVFKAGHMHEWPDWAANGYRLAKASE